MAQARRSLEEQLAKAEQETAKPETVLAGLKELQEEEDTGASAEQVPKGASGDSSTASNGGTA